MCKNSFKYKSNLTEHVKSEHIKCKWCDYQSQSKNEDMDKHYWNAHQEKVAQEEIDEDNLANGFEKESRKKYSCGKWYWPWQPKEGREECVCNYCRDKDRNRLCSTHEVVCCVRRWLKKFKKRCEWVETYPIGYTGDHPIVGRVQEWHTSLIICSYCYKQIHWIETEVTSMNTGNILYNLVKWGGKYHVTLYPNPKGYDGKSILNPNNWQYPTPKRITLKMFKSVECGTEFSSEQHVLTCGRKRKNPDRFFSR